MWVCSRCQSRHETDRMFCPKCGAPAQPKDTNNGAPVAQPRPPQSAPPQSSSPQYTPSSSQPPTTPRNQAPPSQSNYRPPTAQSSAFVDDIAQPQKKKTDPLALAQKQVLRAAERFKEEDATVEDPDEHLTWDSAKSLEHSIDNAKRQKEKRQDHLYVDATRPVSPTDARQSRNIFETFENSESQSILLSPVQIRAIWGVLVLIGCIVSFLIGEVVDQSNATSPADSSEQMNLFTGHVSVSKLEGLWLGTDTINGAPTNVEYIFTDPASLTILTLSPTGSVVGASQATYQFSQSNLTTNLIDAQTGTSVCLPPPTAKVDIEKDSVSLQSSDRTIVLDRPLAISGNWSQVGTQTNGYRYTFNSNSTALVPDISQPGSSKRVTANYVIGGNTLTITPKSPGATPTKYSISFNDNDLILSTTDSTGAATVIRLKQNQ